MEQADTATFRAQFNEARDSLRVVSLVSPTCLVCQYGAGALAVVFDLAGNSDVTGLVAWIPMMDADDLRAAEREAARLASPRVQHCWDGEKRLGNAFSGTLGLDGPAWDVYLLYAPGVIWSGEQPPEPSFWIHQLPSTTGADPGRLLRADTLLEHFLLLLGRPAEATADLALLLHAHALGVVKAERDAPQATLEEVVATAGE